MLKGIKKRITIVSLKRIRRIKFRMKLNKSCKDYKKICKKLLAHQKTISEGEKLKIVLASKEYSEWKRKYPVDMINAMRA
ncbi:MAG: hypothetical protein QMB51_02575 [Patescibacteria group bacterium]